MLDHVDLIDLYRTLNPIGAEYIFFSRAHWTLSKTDHMLGHKYILINLRILKSYQASLLTTMVSTRGGKGKIHKYEEIKQHVPEQPTYQRNQLGNQKIWAK